MSITGVYPLSFLIWLGVVVLLVLSIIWSTIKAFRIGRGSQEVLDTVPTTRVECASCGWKGEVPRLRKRCPMCGDNNFVS
jgi:ribosomal protein S27AE